MKSKPKGVVMVCGLLYVIVVFNLAYRVVDTATVKERRMAEFVAFAKLISEIPHVSLTARTTSTEPLLIRLQKAVEQMDIKDRSPKWSAKEASQGQPSTVTLSLEGVPFDRIAGLLERLSVEPDVAVPAFMLERSGASAERFDFSATFIDISAGS